VDFEALSRAQKRLEDAAAGRTEPASVDAALERARSAVEALAATTAQFEAGLPAAIQDGLQQHFRPSARHLAEVRGLMNQAIRRLERMEGDLLAERHARVDDLGLLVDLVASGWRSVEQRLAHLEESLTRDGATVYRLDRHAR
jgi:hypothetical protein